MHRCGFCAISSFYGKQWLAYTPERTVREMKMLVDKYKVNGIIFSDDNFFIDRKRVERICDLLIKEKLNVKWGAMCRCSYFARYDDAFIDKLRASGCESLFFGAESGSQKILDYIKKDIKVEDIITCAKKTRQHGIKAKFFFMLGFPNETIKDVFMTLRVLDKIYGIIPETLHPVLLYTPYAKTELMDRSMEAGLHPPEDLEGWGLYNFLSYDKPWGDKNYVSLIETISILSQFLLGYQTSERYQKLWQKLAFDILKADANFRWKHKMFKLPFEWKIVKKYMDGQLANSKNQWMKTLEEME